MISPSKDKLHDLAESAIAGIEAETVANAKVGVAMLIIEVKDPTLDITAFYTFCTDGREWIQRAALDEAKMAIDFSEARAEEDGD